MLTRQYTASLLGCLVVAGLCLSACLAKSSPFESVVPLVQAIDPCFFDENCNRDFFKLNNMCCTIVCCNYFDFVFTQSRGDASRIWKNFYRTLEKPRAINDIIALAVLCLVGLFISILLTILGCRR
jgi:hypothetical protein